MYRPIFRHVERCNNCLAFRSVEEIDALATHVYYDLICRGRFATDIIGQHPFVGIRIPGGNKRVVNLFDKDELVIACRLELTIQTITLGGGFALLSGLLSDTFFGRLCAVALSALLGAAVFLLVSRALKAPPVMDLLRRKKA